MNDVTDRVWGRAVKGCAAALALSVVALLVQLGYAFWQARMGRAVVESQPPITVQVLHSLPAQARHLARLGRVALDGTKTQEEFRHTRTQMVVQMQQLMAQMASDPELQAQVQPFISAWAEMETAAGHLYDSLDGVQEMMDRECQWFDQVVDLKARIDTLVREMVASGAAASQVYLALHQLVLVDEISGRVDSIRSGKEHAVLDVAELVQEVTTFTRVLAGLQRGDAEMALRRLQGRRARTALAQVDVQWAVLRPVLDGIAQQAPARLQVHSAAVALEHKADALLVMAGQLAQVSATPTQVSSDIGHLWGVLVTGILVLLSAAGLWQALLHRRREWDEYAAQRDHREQEVFAQLLDEMGALAEGDLSVKATFSEGVAGALAEAINFIVQQLGARIQAMTAAAALITDRSGQAHSKAIQLSEVSQYQREELDAALLKVEQISRCAGALAVQMAAAGEADRQAAQLAAGECVSACADLSAILETVHSVTARLAGEAAQALTALDELAQSVAALRESADTFVLPH